MPAATADPAPAPARGEDADAERGPLRRCIVTREVAPRSALLRFVVSPEGVVIPDVAARLPGRGMWLTPQRALLEEAMRKGAFQRAAGRRVTVPPDLIEQTEALLRRRLADLIGLARRAGQAVAGFEKVREWLGAGRAALLVEARDGSPAERARLAGSAAPPMILALDGETLGRLFGRERVVHVALAPGRLAEAIRTEAARLEGLSPPV
ncbi:MAG: RNA-binding protein [Rhodovarius sp.]|nr:RNA-binding protein [Rhodovarius sp.]MCX7931210.1 RNA-binding protein [Rhodovarius sp.]MDW8314035.1 RNA-binding protein [Rhodovarius sp.]